MARHAYHPQLILVLVVLLLLCSLAMHYFGGRALVLDGLVLDRNLVIQDRAAHMDVPRGGRVVALDDVQVATPADVSVAAWRWRGGHAPVTVIAPPSYRTLVVSADRMLEEPPQELEEGAYVVRLGDVAIDGRMERDELVERALRIAPEPLVVEIRVPRELHFAQALVRSHAPEPRGIAFIVLAALLAPLGVGGSLAGTAELARRELVGVATVAGAVASAAFATLLALPSVVPDMWLWAGVPLVVHRSASFARRLADYQGCVTRTHYALLLVPSALFGLATVVGLALARATTSAAASFHRGESLLLVATVTGLSMWVAEVWLVRAGRDEASRGEWAGLLGPAVLGSLAAGVSAGLGLSAPAWIAAGFVFATVDWMGLLVTERLLPNAATRRPRYRAEDRTLVGLLEEASLLAPDAHVCLAVGLGEAWVGVEAVDLTASGELRAQPMALSNELEAVLGMLLTEGGILPRATDPDDAFEGVASRLGLLAAVPCITEARGDDGRLFLLAIDSDEGGATADLEALVEIAAEIAASGAPTEARGIAVGFLVRRLERARRRGPNGGEEATPTKIEPAGGTTQPPVTESGPVPQRAAPRVEPSVGTEGAPETARTHEGAVHEWTRRLEQLVADAWPVEDPQVLTAEDREWLRQHAVGRGAVLLLGEPGAGKEFIARALHSLSTRAAARYATIDLATVPTSLVEHELFGDEEQPGLVSLLRGGTLLIKAPSRLTAEAARRVVRGVEAGDVRLLLAERYTGPAGGVPSGLVAPWRDAVADRVVPLTPLRERREYAEQVAEYYLQRYAMRYDQMVPALPAELRERVRHDALRSNYLSLQELVREALFGGLSAADDPRPRGAPELDTTWTDEEREERAEILDALARTEWVQAEAARCLGISRGKLLRRIRKFGIERTDEDTR
jgi:hypothetical protein